MIQSLVFIFIRTLFFFPVSHAVDMQLSFEVYLQTTFNSKQSDDTFQNYPFPILARQRKLIS